MQLIFENQTSRGKKNRERREATLPIKKQKADVAIAALHQILLTFLSKEEHHFDKVPVVSQSGEIKRLVSHGVVSGCELISDIW